MNKEERRKDKLRRIEEAAGKDFEVKKLEQPDSAYQRYLKEHEIWKKSDQPIAKLFREFREPKPEYKGISFFGRLFIFWRRK